MINSVASDLAVANTDTVQASGGSTMRASKYLAWTEVSPYVGQGAGFSPGRYEFLHVLSKHLTVRELKTLGRFHAIAIEKGEGKSSIIEKFASHVCPDCGLYVSMLKSCSVSRDTLRKTFRKEYVDKLAAGVKPISLHMLCQLADLDARQLASFDEGARLSSIERVDDVCLVPQSSENRVVCHPVPWLQLLRHSTKVFQVYVAKLHGLAISSRPVRSDIIEQMDKHVCHECKLFYAVFVPVNRAKRTAVPYAKPYEPKQVHPYPPPPINTLEIVDLVRGLCNDMRPSLFEEGGCAVCGQLVLRTLLSPLVSIGCSLDPLKEFGVARLERKSANDPVSFVDGPVLDSDCSSVCADCLKSLRKGGRPTNALANGTWIGRVPAELSELTYAEQCLISRVRCNRYVIRVASGQSKLIANAISFPAPTVKVYKLLPPPVKEVEEILAVIFTGIKPPTDEIMGRTPMLVRRNKVHAALEWLKLNHADYSDLQIDTDALHSYPDSGIPVSIVYKPVLDDSNIIQSATSVHEVEETLGTDSGECPFTVNELIGSNLITMTTSSRKAAALRHLHSGGHVLAVGHSDTPESVYNNPQLYPQMYPWLFPYGLGGIGNPRLQGMISDTKYKKLLLTYHDKRFQYDTRFVLMAFNHEQVKAGTTSSFVLTKRSNFDSVVKKLSQVNPAVVKNIANRLEAGEKVTPATDDERLCFAILDQVEHIGGAVQGSLAGKKRMRAELWSLISNIGAPSWFVTISPVDNKHPICLYWASKDLSFRPDLREYNERARLIAANPVAGARFFHFLVQLFIRHLLKWNDDAGGRGIFGNTSAYYGTVEQQGRMTLHLHMLVWISGSFSPQKVRDKLMSEDSSFKSELIAYLESCQIGEFLTGTMDDMKARHTSVGSDNKDPQGTDAQAQADDPTQRLPLPPPATSCADYRCCDCFSCSAIKQWYSEYKLTVDDILFKSNVHRCFAKKDTASGVAKQHLTGKGCINKDGVCAARFPRDIHTETFVDEDGRITLKKLEPMINTVNPAISYCFGCNSDATCLSSGTAVNATAGYIADYIVKMGVKSYQIFSSIFDVFERNPDIWTNSKSDTDAARRLILKMANSLTSKVEIGGPMAAMYLLGNPDHYTSHNFVPFYWKPYVLDVLGCWDESSAIRSEKDPTSYSRLPTSSSFEVTDEMRSKTTEEDDTGTEQDGERANVDKVMISKQGGKFVSRSNIDDYKLRPTELEDVCLYDWVQCGVRKPLYEVKKHYSDFLRYAVGHPLRDTHVVVWDLNRRNNYIPCVLGPFLPRKNAEDRDFYCCTMLTFFVPWRTGLDLKSTDETWIDRFDALCFNDHHQSIIDNMNIRYECYDARDDFHNQLKSRIAAQLTEEVDGMDDEASGEGDDPDAGEGLLSGELAEGDIGTWTQRKINQMSDVEVALQDAGWCVDGASQQDEKAPVFCPERALPPTRWKEVVERERKALLNARMSGIPNKSRLEDDLDVEIRPMNDARIIPGAHLLADFNITDKDVNTHLENIRRSCKLNTEQERAFNIVAHHALSDSPEPLRMYMGGMGGTGKTRVIKALLQWFEERGESHKMVVLAPTGAAASIIKGSTYHSFLSVRTGEQKQNHQTASRALEDARLRMVGVEYIFIDEISMVSCRDFHLIDARLKEICKQFDVPFGGINMIVAGDFAQLPPAKGQALYSGEVSTVQLPRQVQSDQDNTLGLLLWHQFVTVVILKQNMRQEESSDDDIALRTLLTHLRFKDCTDDDIAFMRSLSPRFNRKIVYNDPLWKDVSVITAWNSHKDKINEMNVVKFSRERKRLLCHFYSIDKKSEDNGGRRKAKDNRSSKQPIRLTSSVQQTLWSSPPHTSDHIAGCLSLCIDMPVMIRYNSATELCITKGQEARVKGWTSREIAGHPGKHCLETLFVELSSPPKPVKLPHLPVNVVPLTRLTSYVRAVLPSDQSIYLTRQQIPVLPNFAMTDYASQGKTRPVNVVDIKHCKNHQAIYTCLSRGTSAGSTMILRDFDVKKVCGGLSGYLRQEFRDLDLLDEITTLQYNGQLPPDIVHNLRASTIGAYRLYKEGLPDPPPELVSVPVKPRATRSKPCEPAMPLKRKRADELSQSKRIRIENELTASSTPMDQEPTVFAPWVYSWKWDAENWSCAYDSFLTILRSLWYTDANFWTAFFDTYSDYARELGIGFSLVDQNKMSLDDVRLSVRRRFWESDAVSFPRGRAGSDLYGIVQELVGLNTATASFSGTRRCRTCLRREQGLLFEGINRYVIMRQNLSLPCSISSYMGGLEGSVGECNFCGGSLVVSPVFSPVIAVQLPDAPSSGPIELSIDTSFSFRSGSYRLVGVVYSGDNHFTSRILDRSGNVYGYDGMLNNGCAVYEGRTGGGSDPRALSYFMGSKSACLALYGSINSTL